MLEVESTSMQGDAFGNALTADPVIKSTIPQLTYGPHKIVLPRRPGESLLAPLQYYYPASPTGVVPCWWGDAQQAESRH
jgi:hypothetical protein